MKCHICNKIIENKKNFERHVNNCKTCPICNKLFHPGKKKQITCSHACANTYFRSGVNNPNFKYGNNNYRTICFIYKEKKCVVCGEEKIVAVHHLDGDRKNNSIDNLIPLCPTHHQYVHSRYKDEVMPFIEEYLKNLSLV